MDFRKHIETVAGLTNISSWHNGDHWVCCAQLHHGLTEVGHGETLGAAMLMAISLVEEHRGKTPLERNPELAKSSALTAALAREGRLPANFEGAPAPAPEADEWDGY